MSNDHNAIPVSCTKQCKYT